MRVAPRGVPPSRRLTMLKNSASLKKKSARNKAYIRAIILVEIDHTEDLTDVV